MIPQAFITEWSNQVPWQTNEQVEQDLVICRALVEIFSDPFLGEQLEMCIRDRCNTDHCGYISSNDRPSCNRYDS